MTTARNVLVAPALALALGLAAAACDAGQPPGPTDIAPTILPPSAISPDQAVRLARENISMTTVVSVTVGRSGDLGVTPGTVGGAPRTADDLVWAVRFSGDITICNPIDTCFPPRPATTTVYLDYTTGIFRMSDTSSPGT